MFNLGRPYHALDIYVCYTDSTWILLKCRTTRLVPELFSLVPYQLDR